MLPAMQARFANVPVMPMDRIADSENGLLVKYKLAQLSFWFNRFKTLPRATRLFKNAKPETLLWRKLFGYNFFCDVSRNGPQSLLFLEGERHLPEARLVQSLLKPEFRIVDVGANIGYYVLLFARAIGPNESIIALEPSPENLPELYINISRNGLGKIVEVIDHAVGNRLRLLGYGRGLTAV
jgi:hypothetical protein